MELLKQKNSKRKNVKTTIVKAKIAARFSGLQNRANRKRSSSALSVLLVLALLTQLFAALLTDGPPPAFSLTAWAETAATGSEAKTETKTDDQPPFAAADAEGIPVFYLNEGDLVIKNRNITQTITGAETVTARTATASNAVRIIGSGEDTTNQTITVEAGNPVIILEDIRFQGPQLLNVMDGAGATLRLEGENEVRGSSADQAALRVAPGARLVIDGSGLLAVSTSGKGAGIGGSQGESNGRIEINDGELTVTTTGRYGEAGIGAGHGAGYGEMIIRGGVVTAASTGLLPGPAIGANGAKGRVSETIEFAGGNVQVSGGWGGVNIGSDGSKSGTILFSGADVEVRPGMQTYAFHGETVMVRDGHLQINSSSVHAHTAVVVDQFTMDGGTFLAPVRYRTIEAAREIRLRGGTSTLSGWQLGWQGDCPAVIAAPSVRIEGGTHTLTADTNGSAIQGTDIQISGGFLTAAGSGTGAAIGSWDKQYPTGTITITGGNIQAAGGATSSWAVGGVDHHGQEVVPTNGREAVYAADIPLAAFGHTGGAASLEIDGRDYDFEAGAGAERITAYLSEGMHCVMGEDLRETVYAGDGSEESRIVKLAVVNGTTGQGVSRAVMKISQTRDKTSKVVYEGAAPGYLRLLPGSYSLTVYADGYHPRTLPLTVSAGANPELTVPLNHSETLSVEVNTRPMTRDEILAAGIDPDAPGNAHLFAFEVTMEFIAGGSADFSYVGDAKGQPVNGGEWLIAGHQQPGGESGTIMVYPISERFYLVIHGEIRWLKEMIDVELVVVNRSLYESMEDCTAVLDALPEGLSLADMSGEAQSLRAELGSIGRGQSRSHHWYLRGDAAGRYALSGQVSARPSAGGTIAAAFAAPDIEILAGNAMHLSIMLKQNTREGEAYPVLFKLENVSAYPVNHLRFQLDHHRQYRITTIDSKNYIKVYEDSDLEDMRLEIEVLEPGASLVIEYSTEIQFTSDLVSEAEFILVDQWLDMLKSSTAAIPYSFHFLDEVTRQKWLSQAELTSLPRVLSPDPVDLLTGSFVWSYQDRLLGGRHDLTYRRTYQSGSAVVGKLGKGWSDNYEYRLHDLDARVLITLPGGGQSCFEKDGEAYRPVAGSAWRLTKAGDHYQLRTADQTRYTFDGEGRVTAIEASGKNRITLDYSAAGQLAQVSGAAGHFTFTYNHNGRLEELTDHTGAKTRYAYHDDGRLSTVENPNGHPFSYHYDRAGYLAEVHDANGLAVVNQYDRQGRVLYQEVADMGGFAYHYDEANRTNRYTRSDGSSVAVVYDEHYRIIREITGDGEMQYTYNDANQRVSTTDRRGYTTVYEYDDRSNVTAIGYPDGSSLRFAYDEFNRPVEITDQNGQVSRYEYNDAGSLIAYSGDQTANAVRYTYDEEENLTGVMGSSGMGMGPRFAYDEKGNCIRAVDAQGAATTYTYDEAGRLASETDALGRTTHYHHDPAGNLAKVNRMNGTSITYHRHTSGYPYAILDGNGNQRWYDYDQQNRITGVTDATGASVWLSYDELGNLVSVTDGSGNASTYTYDHAGRVLSATDALGNTTHYQYDESGNQTLIRDALGGETRIEYDPLNRPVRVTDPRGSTTVYEYDGNRNVIGLTDALGNHTSFIYDSQNNLIMVLQEMHPFAGYSMDPLGRLGGVTDALGNQTRYEHDSNGNLIGTTSADGYFTRYAYDGVNRLTEMTSPDGHRRRVEYDPSGRNVNTINEEGAVTSWSYDGNGNLTAVRDALGHTTAYTYDRADRLVTVTGPEGGTTRYEYDGSGRVTAITAADGSKTVCTYDAGGNLCTVTDGNGHTTRYAYDALNRLVKETYGDGSHVAYTYDANSNLTGYTDENGHTTTYGYDALNRLTESRDAGGQLYRLEYDGRGNVTAMIQDGADGESQVTRWSYDQNGRMLTETNALGHTLAYAYDQRGRVSQKTDGDGHTTTYAYNDLDNLTQVTYQYDRRGNLTGEVTAGATTASYVYDPTNRMVSGQTAAGISRYTYDGLGALVRHNDTAYAGGHTFGIDLPLTSIRDGVPTNHIYGVGGTAALGQGGRTFFVQSDRRQSIRTIRTPEGEPVAGFSYDAWGRPESQIAAGYEQTVFGIPNFTGHHYDAVLGQYYAKARMYSPDRKSFSAPDPVRAGRNWTAYCLNNPLSYTDIYGHEASAEPWWGQLWQQTQAKVDHFINDPYDVGVSWQQFFEHTTAADYKDMVGSGIMAAPNAALGEGVGMLSFMGKGVNSLGRFTVGNLFPSTRPYFERVHCGIDQAVDWVGDTFASDRAAYDFAHTATEKVVMPVYGTAKLVQGAYYGIKHGYGRIKNFLQDETGSVRIGGQGAGQLSGKMTTNSSQIGQKWGKHKADYPNMKSYQDYSNKAQDIFRNAEKIIPDNVNNEIYYIQGNDLLRVSSTGEFISLYPGANSQRVIDAINALK